MQDDLPAEQALKACSLVHFHANRMEELLAPLKGDLDGFLHLCNCSEGFAERMFSYILNRPVRATVIASILRGDKSCKYEIFL